ncbi:hypothetical protein [Candidatus Chlorohelix sp.]|uniref:hypothetical protein n=1 Tax=Candidatus Chlorohelix sp. TaxID=3139201 RepID=UPI003062ED14
MSLKNLVPGLLIGFIFVVSFFFGITLLNNNSGTNAVTTAPSSTVAVPDAVTTAPSSTVAVPDAGGVASETGANPTQTVLVNPTTDTSNVVVPGTTNKKSDEHGNGGREKEKEKEGDD